MTKYNILEYNTIGDKMKQKDIIVITGGAGNIAKAVIEKYLQNNCIVIATDIKEEGHEEFTNNVNYMYCKCDVTDIESINCLKQKIEEEHNRITHFISMAGDAIGTDLQGIENVTIADVDKTIKLNLSSHIYMTIALLPLLKNEKNSNKSIVYVSSINALRAYSEPVYSASKAALYGFTKGILKDMGKLEIIVNTISPGTILRPHEVLKNEQTNGEYAKKRPQPKYKDFALNTDIADAMFCITNVMQKMVGQNIVIDAGQSA